MPYPIEKKFVIAVSSSALFDMVACNRIFEEQGLNAYNDYQMEHIDDPLPQGVAFPFIRRFLTLNDSFPDEQPVEVVLLSKNKR